MTKLYIVEEVAEMIRQHPESIRRLVRAGKLHACRSGWRLLFTEENVKHYLDSNYVNLKKKEYKPKIHRAVKARKK